MVIFLKNSGGGCLVSAVPNETFHRIPFFFFFCPSLSSSFLRAWGLQLCFICCTEWNILFRAALMMSSSHLMHEGGPNTVYIECLPRLSLSPSACRFCNASKLWDSQLICGFKFLTVWSLITFHLLSKA